MINYFDVFCIILIINYLYTTIVWASYITTNKNKYKLAWWLFGFIFAVPWIIIDIFKKGN